MTFRIPPTPAEQRVDRRRTPGNLWNGLLPIVTVFAGRRWVLDDDAQSLAVTVANRYAFRHGYSSAVFARYVRLFAGKMRTDTHTATNLAMWVSPDRCGILPDRHPRVAYILTREQEHNLVRRRARRAHRRAVVDLAATAQAYRAEHGHNQPGPYLCRTCGGNYSDGNRGAGHTGESPLWGDTPDGIRRICPRCARDRILAGITWMYPPGHPGWTDTPTNEAPLPRCDCGTGEAVALLADGRLWCPDEAKRHGIGRPEPATPQLSDTRKQQHIDSIMVGA